MSKRDISIFNKQQAFLHTSSYIKSYIEEKDRISYIFYNYLQLYFKEISRHRW